MLAERAGWAERLIAQSSVADAACGGQTGLAGAGDDHRVSETGQVSGLRARTIAEQACSCTRMRLADLDVDQAGVGERPFELRAGQPAGDSAGPRRHVGLGGLIHVGVGNHV